MTETPDIDAMKVYAARCQEDNHMALIDPTAIIYLIDRLKAFESWNARASMTVENVRLFMHEQGEIIQSLKTLLEGAVEAAQGTAKESFLEGHRFGVVKAGGWTSAEAWENSASRHKYMGAGK